VGEHSFSRILGKGRPDDGDMKVLSGFVQKIAKKALNGKPSGVIMIKGTPNPYRGYYQPRDRTGTAIDIRKVKPLTNNKCTDCKRCADICTMGSIDRNNVREVPGICIKCCACEKRCPVGAKYFDDKNYLYHKTELEAQYTRRAEPELFL
jgi:NAD-dependent dihydropyrimidine dehydrogenase PreA subunit